MDELIKELIEKEWNLFQSVNGDDRVSCQNDWDTFVIMRGAQYRAWSTEALKSYSEDLDRAIAEGRSIVREKYIRMMRSTDAEGYENFKGELPAVSDEKAKLVEEIWAHFAAQTEKMREDYPFIALGGRQLYTRDETYGWASVETYQTSELLTYSEKTLRALLDHIVALEKEGKDFAWMVQENTIFGLGFSDMRSAEKAMVKKTMEEFGVTLEETKCKACGD